MRGRPWWLGLAGAAVLAISFPVVILSAQDTDKDKLPGSDDCLMCHQPGRAGKREPGVPPAFDAAGLRASPHASLECANCHEELAKKEFPHPEKLQPVNCGNCHPDEQEQYSASLHGQALKRGDKLAPKCTDCHGTHNVLRPSDPGSPTAVMQIPQLCGRCHHEGSPVQVTHHIPQDKILENYTESFHGEGLFRRGLVVTAVCTSCHTAHFVLPHTDPRSSISKQNIAKTCEKCHAQIEVVHRKVIRGELWEKQPHMVPACVDCHEPHKIRRVFYAQGMADRDCLRCHGRPDIRSASGVADASLFVKESEIEARPRCLRAVSHGRNTVARAALHHHDLEG